MAPQVTLEHDISTQGVGLHSGQSVRIHLHPAPPDTGIRFRRVDLPGTPEIAANALLVQDTQLCSALVSDNIRVATIEHLMSALCGLAIDNVLVELDGAEIPILDGSAAPFVYLIKCAGFLTQNRPRQAYRIQQPIEVTQGDKWARFDPAEGCRYEFGIDFRHPVFERSGQYAAFDPATMNYTHEVSRARTFAFMQDVEMMHERGLALGGNLDNAIVMDEYKILNGDGLRYDDEFVRHKLLDSIGDLYLLGRPFIGRFSAWKSSHHLNNLLLRALLDNPSSYTTEAMNIPHEKAPPC